MALVHIEDFENIEVQWKSLEGLNSIVNAKTLAPLSLDSAKAPASDDVKQDTGVLI